LSGGCECTRADGANQRKECEIMAGLPAVATRVVRCGGCALLRIVTSYLPGRSINVFRGGVTPRTTPLIAISPHGRTLMLTRTGAGNVGALRSAGGAALSF